MQPRHEWSSVDSIHDLLRAIADRFSLPPDDWWLSSISPYLVQSDGFPLTGTDIGLMVGIVLNDPAKLQLSLQFRSDEIDRVREAIDNWSGQGSTIAEDLAKLDSVRQGTNIVHIDFALGTVLGQPENMRLYVGSLDRPERNEFAAVLRESGLWRVDLSERCSEIVERLRLCSSFRGFSKRILLEESYMLYFIPDIPLDVDVINYVVPRNEQNIKSKLVEFYLATSGHSTIGALDHSWAVAVDMNGELSYLKLELKMGDLRSDVANDEAVEWLVGNALASKLQAIPYGVSCGANSMSSREVVYFAFDSVGVKIKSPVDQSSASSIHQVEVIHNANTTEVEQRAIKTIDDALEAVLARQNKDGSWTDFAMPYFGESDSWVTAHIGIQLASLSSRWHSTGLKMALNSAGQFLTNQGGQGWGFNSQSFVDADSTANALLFIHSIDHQIPSQAFDVLKTFWVPNEGFATVQNISNVPSNWCTAHPDVTPLALQALAISPEANEIDLYVHDILNRAYFDELARQNWPAFWWNLNWYTISAWCNCINALGYSRAWSGVFKQYVQEQLGRFSETDSFVDEGLKLKTMALTATKSGMLNSINRLTLGQSTNGLWPSGRILRMDPRLLQNSPSIGGSVFGTSTILASLALSLEEISR
jgi:hypothetical protein